MVLFTGQLSLEFDACTIFKETQNHSLINWFNYESPNALFFLQRKENVNWYTFKSFDFNLEV